MAEGEEAFEGVIEFSLRESSKDLSQIGKLFVLKPEQEAFIRDQSVDRMSLQSIYQIPIGDYVVTAVICGMSLRRYVLKTYFKASKYTVALTF